MGLGVVQAVFLEEVLPEPGFKESSRSPQGGGLEGHRTWLWEAAIWPGGVAGPWGRAAQTGKGRQPSAWSGIL